jgi:hypothetical protein
MRIIEWATGRAALRRLNADLLQANAELRGGLEQRDRLIESQQRLITALREVNAELDRAVPPPAEDGTATARGGWAEWNGGHNG